MWKEMSELPEIGESVLCLSNGSAKIPNIVIDTLVVDEGVINFTKNYAHNYSHWMPLPEPPTAGHIEETALSNTKEWDDLQG